MTKNSALPPGKLNPQLLQRLIAKLPEHDASIIIPPGIGFDAAGITIGGQLVAITTDPITFSTNQIGTYSVAVNINDVACLGCKPHWYSATLLLPIGTTEPMVEAIWQNLSDELKRYQIQSIGGHCEITGAVKNPVIIGQMIGEIIGEKFLSPKDGQPGDQILLWRGAAIEGTALIATEMKEYLKNHISVEKITAMQNLLLTPGICIWPLVEKLVPHAGLVALHDPTEGGIATALHEIADASNCGVAIDGDTITILPGTQELAQILHFDPLGLLASGSLLILCRPSEVDHIIDKIKDESLTRIGELTNDSSRTMTLHGIQQNLPRFDTDEITRFLLCDHH